MKKQIRQWQQEDFSNLSTDVDDLLTLIGGGYQTGGRFLVCASVGEVCDGVAFE